jgi:hypothetical protein
MQMGVMQQLLVPGMQHGQKADSGSEAAWIGGNGEQRLGDGLEQQIVNRLRIAERQRGEPGRQREYNMAVRDRQKFPASGFKPLLARAGLAFRAVPVAAGVERSDFVRAVIAPLDVGPQLAGLACADVAECPDLMEAEYAAPSAGKFLFVLAKDIGDFKPTFGHSSG